MSPTSYLQCIVCKPISQQTHASSSDVGGAARGWHESSASHRALLQVVRRVSDVEPSRQGWPWRTITSFGRNPVRWLRPIP